MPGSSLLPAFLAGTLENAVARFLAMDPNASQLLHPLRGKVLGLRLSPFSRTVFLYPTASGVQIHGRIERDPDVLLSGTPWAFARAGFGSAPETTLFGGGVRIEGDMDVARCFRALLDALQIDWEGQLAGVLGRNVADRVFAGLRAGRRWSNESLDTLKLNLAEYLQEESRDLPAATELDAFLRDVDSVRDDCDRLEVRIQRLAAALAPAPGIFSQGAS